MAKISIIHPSRGRYKLATNCYLEWITKAADRENIEYILSCDVDDPQLIHYAELAEREKLKLVVGENKNVVQAMNAGIKLVTGDIVVCVSDDFSCPVFWDRFILENIDAEKEEALAVNDGLQPIDNPILTLPILTKKLVDKLGYIYFTEYTGIKADDDLANLCRAMGCLKTNYSQQFNHNHWVNKKKPRDATNNRHDNPEGWRLGIELFEKRKAKNFGI